MAQDIVGGGHGQCITCIRGFAASDCCGWGLGFVAAVLLGLSWVAVGYGAPGDLDLTFGTGGVAFSFGPQDLAKAIVLQPDGKLVVANSIAGPNGLMPQLTSVLPDGQLVAAGTHSLSPPATRFPSTDILLARYQALGCPAADPDPCLASLAAFVTEVYQAVFARQPDAGEEAYWVDVLATEPTPDTVHRMPRVVFDGPEFRQMANRTLRATSGCIER